jgi:hypothetical protein
MRIYLDFELDESYTPTKVKFYAEISEGGLLKFGTWEVTETTDPETGETHSSIEDITGWIDVPLKGVGGRETRWHGNLDVLEGDEEPTLYPMRSELEKQIAGDDISCGTSRIRLVGRRRRSIECTTDSCSCPSMLLVACR